MNQTIVHDPPRSLVSKVGIALSAVLTGTGMIIAVAGTTQNWTLGIYLVVAGAVVGLLAAAAAPLRAARDDC
jgi:hypothetical protein